MPKSNCSCKNNKLPDSQILNELHQEGIKWKRLAKIFGVGERTIRRKANPSKKEKERQKAKQKTGPKEKIVGRIQELLFEFTAYRSKDNTLNQQEMADRIKKEEKIIISQQSVSRFLIKKKRTNKKIHPRYKEQDINQVKQFRETIKDLPLSQFSAIDECHFYLNESPRRGYAPIGQRAISPAPGSKGGSYSLIIWVKNKGKKGVVNWDLTAESVNTNFFYNFLEKVESLGEEEDYLIMDNASFHRAPDKRKELGLPSIEEQLSLKNSKPLAFPARSPMFNPVEPIINNIRHNIEKSRSWTFKKLWDSVDREMKRLNGEDLNKYFKKCLQDNLVKLINESEFRITRIDWERWEPKEDCPFTKIERIDIKIKIDWSEFEETANKLW